MNYYFIIITVYLANEDVNKTSSRKHDLSYTPLCKNKQQSGVTCMSRNYLSFHGIFTAYVSIADCRKTMKMKLPMTWMAFLGWTACDGIVSSP